MRWTNERRRQSRVVVALGRVQLRLDKKDAPGQVGTPKVGASQVGTNDVGHSQVGTSEVGTDEVCPSQAGASEVGALELRSDQVRTPIVRLRVLDPGSRVLARLQQQEIDASSVLSHVELQEGVRTALGKAIGLPQRPAGLLIAKSAEAAKAGTTQHSAKQLAQSARR